MPHDQATPGTYKAHPSSAGFGETHGGTRYFGVMLNLAFFWDERVPDEDKWVPLSNPRQALLKLWLSKGGRFYTRLKLDKMGFNGDYTAPSFSGDPVEEGVDLVCTHNPRGYEEWDLLMPRTGAGLQGPPPDDGYIRQLNAEWQNEMGAGSPAPPPPPPSGAAGGPVGDGTDAAEDPVEPPF